MPKRVRVSDFGAAIDNILTEYAGDVTRATHEAVLEAAKIAKQETQSGAPVGRRGRYKKGWAVREETSRLRTEAIVHNRTDYQLAHLLEKGHALRNGGRTNAKVHIRPAEQHAIEHMKEALKKIAEG